MIIQHRMTSCYAWFLALTILVFCSATSGVHAENADKPFTLIHHDHPLVGKIWDVTAQQYITRDQLLLKVLASDYVLLGETHDNIKHHEEHGWMISALSRQKPGIAVAFEMVNQEQADTVNKSENLTTGKLLDILEQAKTGWEYKKYYRPVFESIVNAKLKIYPADLDRPTMMNVVSKGEDHTPDQLKSLLERNPLPPEEQEALKKEIEETHCGMINEEMTRAMMTGQRVRDAAIGNNLYTLKKSDTPAVVLVAGSGHIRKDRGAPMYLKAQDKTASILTIAWMEADEEGMDPKAYGTRWGRDTLPFDYVVFTPAADRPDPCEEMKKFMQHKKNHGKKSGE
ncbi:MAG: ChaN family lipoprotein [Gammaproteobacteria bacterium]|nr:ChaN family lipoprotein [Gammaproteobacteria bacterium]